ncbi:MAG: [FeFe] hydrogenase, group A [Synergistaceae bacterium]|jgi:NADH-quinone oxidoreductase subunit G/NADP-reducing hydrogenase subunit HndD|nr:[FeFe] hydrogenase, group A [Synergistaceae bacterium]
MVNLTINGQPITAEEGTTIIEAARRHGISIPNLCYMKDVHKIGACRLCVVEVEGARALMASCLATVSEGMVVHTNTEKLRRIRRVLFELMYSDHSEDCLSCSRNQNCEFQAMGKLLSVDSSRFEGERSSYHVDASVSVTRDMSKCILCRRCVTVCNEVQGVGALFPQHRGFDTEMAPAMEMQLGKVACTFCGQCSIVCPVGALKSTNSEHKVWAAIGDPNKVTVVQVAPAVRVALGEVFGLEPGTSVTGKMAASFRRMGFDHVFDTNFGADLTIMEEGAEFLGRVRSALNNRGAVLPMITSCSPGWVKYVEHMYPDHLAHLSTCKSPHTMLGAVVKSYYAERIGVDPKDIFVVSVMPCTAKKFEITRPEMQNGGYPNVDAVITTRELACMIKYAGIDFVNLDDEEFDNPLGMSTGAADIFGLTGGVMEAALRTVYELVTGRTLPFDGLHVTPIVGFERIKEAALKIENPLPDYSFLDGVEVRIAVTSGLAGAKILMDQLKAGNSPYHFIEVMGCPGGCIMGGGQPRSRDNDIRNKRLRGLYTEDEGKPLRKSHENPFIKSLYDEFLGEPNGHKSHELLHTSYVARGKFNQMTEQTFVADAKVIAKIKTAAAIHDQAKAAISKLRQEEAASPKVFELESENRRLKMELADALETVDILKSVFNK